MKICGKWKFVISFWNLMSNTERGKEENLMVKKLFISRWKSHCSFLFLAPQKKIFWRGVSFSSSSLEDDEKHLSTCSSAGCLVQKLISEVKRLLSFDPCIDCVLCCLEPQSSPLFSSLSFPLFPHTLLRVCFHLRAVEKGKRIWNRIPFVYSNLFNMEVNSTCSV